MHELLRKKILRRIDDGTQSVTNLARQTGLAQAHVSNFLREKRRLSWDDKLVLRPLNLAFPIELLQSEPDRRVQEFIAGRVVMVLNQT